MDDQPDSDAILVTQRQLAEALHASNAGGICPTEECDYHWQMAKAALRQLRDEHESL
jgi:hypothetical protein